MAALQVGFCRVYGCHPEPDRGGSEIGEHDRPGAEPGGSCVQGSKYAADRTVYKKSEKRPVPAPRAIFIEPCRG